MEKMRVMIFKLMCPNVMLVHILCLQLIRLIQNPRLLAKKFKLAAIMKNLPYTDTGSMVESARIMALLVMA